MTLDSQTLLVVGTSSFCRRAGEALAKERIPFSVLVALEEKANVEEVREALLSIGGFDWGLFASVNAVMAVASTAERLGLKRPLDGLRRVGAVGPTTAKAVASIWDGEVFIPTKYTTSDLAEQLPNVEGSSIISFRSELSGDGAEKILYRRGARRVVLVRAYSLRIREDVEVPEKHSLVILGSPSSALAYNVLCRARGKSTRPAICIGPVTYEAASKLGLEVVGIADEQSIEGLVRKAREVMDAE